MRDGLVQRGLLATVLACGMVPSSGAGQTAERADARSSDVTAILVDVVVRDRAGNPVPDLEENEIEIIEDGVKQKLGSFTPIFKNGPARAGAAGSPDSAVVPPFTPTAPGAAAVAAAVNAPNEVLALVFDRLTPEPRELAYRAALAYAGSDTQAERLVAVYGIDLGLVPYQMFTPDIAKVRRAIEQFGTHATSQFGSTREQRMDAREQLLRAGAAQSSAEQVAAGGGPGAGAAGAAIAGTAGDVQFQQMQLQMLETFDALERDQRGYSTANALMAVVSSMRGVPGRKAIVFFSEGLSIPTNAQERFVAVVAAANRANVSIYSVDAGGLRVESTLKEARDEITAATTRSLNRNPSRDQVDEPMMAALERNENNLRLDPHSGLGVLADQTGGLLVSNTNDFRRGLGRVDGDLRNYYMLTYVPSNTEFDGRFRQISVKVSRPGVTVQHRKGYFGVRAPAGTPVLGYEAPALAMLDRTPVPNAFPVRAAALHFPDAEHPGQTPIIVQLPTANLTFRPADDDPARYHSDATVLVRFVDERGEIVDKTSQRYELQGPIGEIERARLGEVIFYRQPDLPVGIYRMETVVYDALARKASVRFTTVERPPVDADRLRLSSLVVVRRGEKVPEAERLQGSPLYIGETLVYPNLGDPLKRGIDKELGFYFTAYLPASATSGETTATLELLKNAQPLARVPLELNAPDSQHRIQQVGRIPVEQLAAGTYELHIVVRQGSTAVGQTATFRLTD